MREKTKSKKAKSSDIALKVEHVSKSFHLPTEQSNSIKQAFINRMRGIKGYKKQQVLKDISFEVEKGDFFGIVGRNGSGKSTLLKLISQIYHPDSGKITVNGSLVPFIELGVGFNPELTGRENVYLNGAMLGFSKNEIDDMYDDIVEFAEIADFMDQKLKNYSSGMQVRLAFSVAIKAQGDILVLDEVLAVGDEAFQRKCFGYFAELKRNKKTVILVSHSMESVARFCNKAIMVSDGKIIERGSVKLVTESYTRSNIEITSSEIKHTNNDTKKNAENPYADVSLVLGDGNGKMKTAFYDQEEDRFFNVKTTLTIKKDIDKETFCSILFKNDRGEIITRIASEDIEGGTKIIEWPRRGERIVMESRIQNIFGEGEYSIAVSLKSIDRSESYVEAEDKVIFSVAGLGLNGFSLRPDNTTTITKEKP